MYVQRGVPAGKFSCSTDQPNLVPSSISSHLARISVLIRCWFRTVFQGDPGEISTRETPLTERPSTPAAFSRRDAIDAVNLNVGGDKGLTMTFVETVNDG